MHFTVLPTRVFAPQATFTVTVGVPSDLFVAGYSALSNAPALEDNLTDDANYPDHVFTRFARTPPMSAYFVAFAVHRLTPVRLDPVEGALHRVRHTIWARQEMVDGGWTNFSASYLAPVLAAYEELLGVDYPLEKLDTFVQPIKMAGGMENWYNQLVIMKVIPVWQVST